jgi:hypothetical protein
MVDGPTGERTTRLQGSGRVPAIDVVGGEFIMRYTAMVATAASADAA